MSPRERASVTIGEVAKVRPVLRSSSSCERLLRVSVTERERTMNRRTVTTMPKI